MNLRVLPIPRHGNPLYPLPADYNDLTAEGQRKARVNACRLWTIPDLPDADMALNLVASTHFFDLYYLHPDPSLSFDPGFYDQTPLVSAPFHWEMSSLWASSRFSAIVAPRGSAKSTHLCKDTGLRIVSAPNYSFVYATSTHDNAKHVGQRLKDLCYHNPRVQEDFAPEYGRSTLQPIRGEKSTGIDYFHLNNGSWLRCLSSESRIRGVRPRRFRLDDPEYDAKASTSMSTIRDYMETLLFKVAIPTVLRAGSALDWTGTFVSRRHFLWHVVSAMQDGGLTDPRLSSSFWKRIIIRACHEEDDGRLTSCWPHMWPSDEAERDRLALSPSTLTLPQVREILGPAVFNSEMQAKPGEATTAFFRPSTDPRGRHAFWFEGIDPSLFQVSPFASPGSICYLHPVTSDPIRTPLVDFARSLRLFMTVDTAYTEKTTSDRRVCSLFGLDPDNILFWLDMWSDRRQDSVLIENSLRMCERWGCRQIHVEVVKQSKKLYERYQSTLSTRFTATLGIGNIPSLHPFNPGVDAKVDRIATLDTRFDHGLIKMPYYLKQSNGPFSRLFDQIDSFNPEVEDGGLQHDDELDTGAMTTFIIRGRTLRRAAPHQKGPLNPILEMEAGRLQDPYGTPHAYGVPLQLLSTDLIEKLCSVPPTPQKDPL